MSNAGVEWQRRAREQFETLIAGIASQWSSETETVRRLAEGAAREQWSEILNQGLRRLRETSTIENAAQLTFELALPFASRCALFLFRDAGARAEASRGFGSQPLDLQPDQGAAFRAAIESRDPVIAVSTPSEISPALAARVSTETAERVYLFPLVVRSEVKAMLFAAGTVAAAPVELIAGIGAMQMEILTAPAVPKRGDLVAIQGAAAPAVQSNAATPVSAWSDLSPDLQTLHLRAQRMARLRVAEFRLEHGDGVREGLLRSDLYQAIREPIDRARLEFREQFVSATPTMVDYLYLEIVRGLAHNDERLLGPGFPGPLI